MGLDGSGKGTRGKFISFLQFHLLDVFLAVDNFMHC